MSYIMKPVKMVSQWLHSSHGTRNWYNMSFAIYIIQLSCCYKFFVTCYFFQFLLHGATHNQPVINEYALPSNRQDSWTGVHTAVQSLELSSFMLSGITVN